MKGLILWADPVSTNLGVRTLARGTQRLLASAFPGIEVHMQSFGAGDAPVRIGSPRRQLQRLVSRQDELVEWVRQFDLVVDTRAGDSFADIYGVTRLTTMGLMNEIVRRAGAPVVMGPQTIGPFASRRGRLLAHRTLRTSRLVFARDPVSMDVAARLGRPVDQLTTDVVFALDEVATPERMRDVMLNVSGLLWEPNSHLDHLHYRETVVRLVHELHGRGREVALLAHVLSSDLDDDDVDAVHALAARVDRPVEILVPNDLDDVRAMLATAAVVLGSRMHACLNALSLGRPAVPLAYSRKFAPLLDGIGWGNTVDLRGGHDVVAAVLAAVDDPALLAQAARVRDTARERIDQTRNLLAQAF